MKVKNLFVAAAAFALLTPAFTNPVHAAWAADPQNAGKPTDVSYDNSSSIPDPDNPSNPNWTVKIPSSIKFTDSNKKVDASISIDTINNGTFPTYKVYVGVKSTNGYKLKLKTAELDYDLQYTMNGTMTSVKANAGKAKQLGSFDANLVSSATIKGESILSGTATETGSYTDTLTYSISKNPIITN